jgi:uncharacterized Zn finger protein
MTSDVHGVVKLRNGGVVLRCCDCGLFIRHGEETVRNVTGVMMIDPEWEYIHKVCPPKKGAS